MFYYAEINGEYLVINTHSLAESSTNPKYIPITEEQYVDGDLVDKYYNSLTGNFEIVDWDDTMGGSHQVSVYTTNLKLSTQIDNMQAEINSKVDANHTHNGYASADDLQILEDIVDTKADSVHNHSEYASASHSHSEYATTVALDTLSEEVAGKADSVHEHNYAPLNHDHNETYAPLSHSHADYVTTTEIDVIAAEIEGKADIAHNHSNYADISHGHTASEIGAAVSGHNHNDTYYTETEIDSKLAGKSDISHNHADVYDVNGAAANALLSAQIYTDSKIDALVGEGASITLDTIGEISAAIEDNQDAIDLLNSAIVNKANAIDLNAHASDTEIHISEAERNAWNAKSNFSGNYNDLTNKPTIPSINGLATETYVDAKIDAIDIPSALSDLTADSTHRVVTDAEKASWNAKSNFSGSYNDLTNKPSIPSVAGLATETYVDEAVSNKANSSHTHTIANVSGLQNALDAKSDSTHNHNNSYDTLGAANSALTAAKSYVDELIEDEVTNRNSAIATAKSSAISTAASDATTKANNALASAKTYTDEAIDALSETVSTKASASTLTSHTGNTTVHITSAERTNWNAAKTHADSAHAPTTNATQTTAGLMSKADKIKLDGIAEGANNYTLPSAGTSLGGVKTGGDVTISSGVITVNDDSHNHIISNIDGLQSALDGKATSSHNHDGVYYTETEIDTLLEGKANASHTHTIANITNLQSTLDGKAAASHGTHVSYSTTAPVMDGSASVGTASTVARSDHKHPTDTSRAAQTSLDSHTGNKSNPHGVTLAQLGITATAAELNALDGITATVTELNYVDGVTSNIQTQLNAKAASSHSHSYAGSSSAGGAATSANKLNTNAGDTNTPVYFSDGIPVACTSLDLNTTGSSASCTGNAATATNVAWSGVTSKPSYYDAKAIKSITRSGTTFTYTCMDGTTGTFTQQDNNTTYSVATTSANGLMSSSDKSKLNGMVLATVSEVETYLGI